MGIINHDQFDYMKGNNQQSQLQSPAPQPASFKRPGEPIEATELSVRLMNTLDIKMNFDSKTLDDIFFFLEKQLDDIKEKLIYFADDAKNKFLDEDPSERLGEAIQSFNTLREIMTFKKNLYNPHFNAQLDPRSTFKYVRKLEDDRKASAIYGDVINSFFMFGMRQNGTVVPNFLITKVKNSFVVPLEVVFDAVGMYYNNINESGIVKYDQDILYGPFIEAFITRLNDISDDEYKKIAPNTLATMLGDIEKLAEATKKSGIIERTADFIFEFSLKGLKSNIMGKRIFGLNSIAKYVENLSSKNNTKNPMVDRIYDEAFPIIFGKDSHINLIKDSDQIIKYVFNDPFITNERRDALFNIIWKSIITQSGLISDHLTEFFEKERSITTKSSFTRTLTATILKTPGKEIIQSMEAINFICKTLIINKVPFDEKQKVIEKLYSLLFSSVLSSSNQQAITDAIEMDNDDKKDERMIDDDDDDDDDDEEEEEEEEESKKESRSNDSNNEFDEEKIWKCRTKLCDNFYKMEPPESDLRKLIRNSLFTLSNTDTNSSDYQSVLYFVNHIVTDIEKAAEVPSTTFKAILDDIATQTGGAIFSIVEKNLIDFAHEHYNASSLQQQPPQFISDQLKEQLLFIALLCKSAGTFKSEDRKRMLNQIFECLFMSDSQDCVNVFASWASDYMDSGFADIIASHGMGKLALKFASSNETLDLFKSVLTNCEKGTATHRNITTIGIYVLMNLYSNQNKNTFKTFVKLIKLNGIEHPEKELVSILPQAKENPEAFQKLLNAIYEVINLSLTQKQRKFFAKIDDMISSSSSSSGLSLSSSSGSGTPLPTLESEKKLHFNVYFKGHKDKTLDILVEKTQTLDFLIGEMFDFIEEYKESFDLSKLSLSCLLEGSETQRSSSPKRVYISWYASGYNGKEIGEIFKDGLSWRVEVSAPHNMDALMKSDTLRNPKKSPRSKQESWFKSETPAVQTEKYPKENEEKIEHITQMLEDNNKEYAISILIYYKWDLQKASENIGTPEESEVKKFHKERMDAAKKDNQTGSSGNEHASTKMDVEEDNIENGKANEDKDNEEEENSSIVSKSYIWDEGDEMRNALYAIFSQLESSHEMNDSVCLTMLRLLRYFRPPPLDAGIGARLTEMAHNGQYYLTYYWLASLCEHVAAGEVVPSINPESLSGLVGMLHGERTINLMLCLVVLRAYRIFNMDTFAFDAFEGLITASSNNSLRNAVLTELYLGSYKGTERFLTSDYTLRYVLTQAGSPALCNAFADAFSVDSGKEDSETRYRNSIRALQLFTRENVCSLKESVATVFFGTLTRITASLLPLVRKGEDEELGKFIVDKCGVFHSLLMDYASKESDEDKWRALLGSENALRFFVTLVKEVSVSTLTQRYSFADLLKTAFVNCPEDGCVDEWLLKYLTFVVKVKLVPDSAVQDLMERAVIPYAYKTAAFLRARAARDEVGVEARDLDSDDNGSDASGGVRYPGIKNMGNTCYLNSILQQLYFTKEFRSLVLDELDLGKVKAKDGVAEASLKFDRDFVEGLKGIFASLEHRISPVQYLKQFLSSFDKSTFDVNKQQDAVEFFGNICDRIERIVEKYYDADAAKLFVAHLNSIFRIPFDERFAPLSGPNTNQPGESKPSYQNAFQVEICNKSISTVEDGIETSLKEEISDINKVKLVRFSHEDPPKTLVLHLKRFEYNISQGTKKKISKRVAFDTTLDISRFSTSPSSALMYHLRGVVIHSGTGEHGHYYSFISTPTGWFKFDDSYVKPFNTDDMEKECFGNDRDVSNHSDYPTSSAYMLFYEKVESSHMEVERPNAIDYNDAITENVPMSISSCSGNGGSVAPVDENKKIIEIVEKEMRDRRKTKCGLGFNTLNFVYWMLSRINGEDNQFDTDGMCKLLDYMFRALSMRINCADSSSYDCSGLDVLFIMTFEKMLGILAECNLNVPVNEDLVKSYLIANGNSKRQEIVRAYTAKLLQSKTKVCPGVILSKGILNEATTASTSTINTQYLLLLKETIKDNRPMKVPTAHAVLRYIKNTYLNAKEDSAKILSLEILSNALEKLPDAGAMAEASAEDKKEFEKDFKYFSSKDLVKEYIGVLNDDAITNESVRARKAAKATLASLCKDNFATTYNVFKDLANSLSSSSILSIMDTLRIALESSTGAYTKFESVLMCDVILETINAKKSELLRIAAIPSFLEFLTKSIRVAVESRRRGGNAKTQREFMAKLRQNVLYLQEVVFNLVYKRIATSDIDQLPELTGYYGILLKSAPIMSQMYSNGGKFGEDAKKALYSFAEFRKVCSDEFGITDEDEDDENDNGKDADGDSLMEPRPALVGKDDTIDMAIDDDGDDDDDNGKKKDVNDADEDEMIRRENEWLKQQIRAYIPDGKMPNLKKSGLTLSEECLEYAKHELGIQLYEEKTDLNSVIESMNNPQVMKDILGSIDVNRLAKDNSVSNNNIGVCSTGNSVTVTNVGNATTTTAPSSSNQLVIHEDVKNSTDDDSDIETVMETTCLSRDDAIKLLKRANGNVERAIDGYFNTN